VTITTGRGLSADQLEEFEALADAADAETTAYAVAAREAAAAAVAAVRRVPAALAGKARTSDEGRA
jgi:hypothetical protein